ncbi:MAG: class I SAM-dependent methyltransferase [Candidatus Tectomicrobia bacterium]|nr:class I SAM-dependent methyltransferase [Candidatus Tectomicrobia bacterium]
MTSISATDTPWGVYADLYDLEFDSWASQDLPFYLQQARRHPPLLELACGTGRLAIPIAQAGVPVVGLDASAKMLARAREKAGGLSNPQFVHGRMETFDLQRQFGAILIAFSSFYDLPDVAAQERTLRNIRRHLQPGGRLMMDMFLYSAASAGTPLIPNQAGDEARLVARLSDPATGYVHLIWEAVHHMPHEQLLEMNRVVQTFNEKEISTGEARHFQIAARYVHRFEMQHLLRLCGFEIVGLYGGFHDEPFDASSSRMVWIATPGDDR